MMDTWETNLLHAARTAECWDGDLQVITNEAHGRTLTACLQAFGCDAGCSVLIEARPPDRAAHGNARPADVVVLHPYLGVLFIEVKGWMLDTVTYISDGTVHRWVNGRDEAKDPWAQAANSCSDLQTAVRRVYKRRGLTGAPEPYFDCMVAFAHISTAGWVKQGFGRTHHADDILFSEDLQAPERLRAKLLARMKAKAGRRLLCSPGALDSVREALGSSRLFKKHNRRSRSCRVPWAL